MRIILGLGGAPDAMIALDQTVERVTMTGDSLTVAILENPASDRSPDAIQAAVEEALASAKIEADIVQLEGDPGPALAEYAETEDFDRIVLGGGQRSPMGKIAVGEIAEFVLLNADRTVTLIR